MRRQGKNGTMSAPEQREYLKKYKVELISLGEMEIWKRGASNAGYHYLDCAKTFALMGEAFAQAVISMQNSQKP
jgi:alpha-galactosidase